MLVGVVIGVVGTLVWQKYGTQIKAWFLGLIQ